MAGDIKCCLNQPTAPGFAGMVKLKVQDQKVEDQKLQDQISLGAQ